MKKEASAAEAVVSMIFVVAAAKHAIGQANRSQAPLIEPVLN